MTRLAVPKTYKLYIGGAFPRSESGRTYEIVSAKGAFLANAAKASRKDARDAVVAARAAVGGWSGATAYNRGQVLYRIAELLEGRRAQFVAEIVDAEGVSAAAATAQVDAAIDRWVWYAGWADKYAQVAGNANPVAGPYFNISVPEPTGRRRDHRAAGLVAARAGVRGRAGARRRATRSSWWPARSCRCRRSACPRSSPRATCPRASSTCSPGSPAEIAPWLASHAGRQRARPGRRRRPRLGRPADRRGRHAQARPPAGERSGRGGPVAGPHHGVRRDEDRLAHEGPDLRRDDGPHPGSGAGRPRSLQARWRPPRADA